MADEETFFVVVGVDEPTRDAFGSVAADFAGLRVEDVDAVNLDLDLIQFVVVTFGGRDVDVRFAEDHAQVFRASVFEFVGHAQAGVYADLRAIHKP